MTRAYAYSGDVSTLVQYAVSVYRTERLSQDANNLCSRTTHPTQDHVR